MINTMNESKTFITDEDNIKRETMQNLVCEVRSSFLGNNLVATLHILILMIKDTTDDCITCVASTVMNSKVHLAITDVGLLLYSSRPELAIPYHLMTKDQIGKIKAMIEYMTSSNAYVTGSKMLRGYFAAPSIQSLYVVPSHCVLHACISLLQKQKLPRPVYEFMLHRILRTCDLPEQVVADTCLMLEAKSNAVDNMSNT